MQEGLGQGRLPELTCGGPVRSKGAGLSHFTRRSGRKEEFDERILGSSDFVNDILKETRKSKTPAKTPTKRQDNKQHHRRRMQ